MLQHEIHCDVSFKVGKEEKLVRAHKYVLASRSPVFDALLYGDLAESNEIKIPDIEPSAFNVLLRFLYCGDIDLNQDTVIGALYAADKYDVEELMKASKSYLDQNITYETVCTILENAKLFNFENLTEKCMNFIVENCNSVLQSPSALGLMKETLSEIVSSKYLNMEELEMYHFLISWAENQCEKKGLTKSDENIRNEIGDTLYQVRFQSMNLETFVKDVCRREILTPDEMINLQQIIVGNLHKGNTKFNLGERKYKTFTFLRCSDQRDGWDYKGTEDSIEFTVNRDVKLHGFMMWGGKSVPYTYTVERKLFENSNDVADVPSQPIEITNSSDIQFVVKLRKPVLLYPSKRYRVWVRLQGPRSWTGQTYKQSVNERGVQLYFYTHGGQNNGTSDTGGQFPGFILSL
ncbi:BTB/POZ domain-containing protein 6-like [Saccostrea echinata]|uniref:BTB/POZ domain-containing protein 6-like n=1 Tax=Saccostrea echinata TaxID=191078 RepID=UPI002A82D690|nr:BTB/POZ domain-containing protein 6-like [Saccostrea echinata]